MNTPALDLNITPTFKVDVKTTEDPVIRDQARAFKTNLVQVLTFYMREVIRSDRTTVYNALCDAGHKDLAEMIRRI